MVDRGRVVESIPHYIAMLVAIFLALGIVRETVGELDFWIEFLLVLVIAFAYPPLVRRLGVAPSAWSNGDSRS